jgi:hypothetical protein
MANSGLGGGANGGTLNNCTLTTNVAASGGGASGSTLNNCTLTGNGLSVDHFYYSNIGGGAYDSTLNNCTLTGNFADRNGGGADGGTLNNCTLTNNFSGSFGGGAMFSTLNNCTLTGNRGNDGGGAYGGTLNNCTLTGNEAFSDGGGACDSTLNNCTLTGNEASYGGGGAYGGTLNNCVLTSNSAVSDGYGNYGYGGGDYGSTLINCTLTGNSAYRDGGGAYDSTLNNCIVFYNTAPIDPNYSGSTFNYCCTTPLPPGTGNITNEPAFVDSAAGNYRLWSYSPCVNAGTNQDWMVNATDLDGNPRISFGVVDMGAFELNDHPPMVSDLAATATQNQPLSIATDKLLAHASDPDSDPLAVSAVSAFSTNGGAVVLSAGVVNYTPVSGFVGLDRFTFTVSDDRGGTATGNVLVTVIAGNAPSLNMLPPVYIPGAVQIRFAGIVGRTYSVQRAPAVTGPWTTIGTATVGPTGIASFNDDNPPPDSAFYRTAYP